MFKTKFLIVDEDWNLIHQYKARIKPSVDEFIYLEPRYFKVLAIIHTQKIIPESHFITVVVKEWENIVKT